MDTVQEQIGRKPHNSPGWTRLCDGKLRRKGAGERERKEEAIEIWSAPEMSVTLLCSLEQAGVKDPQGAPSLAADVTGTPLLSELACQYDALSQ